MLIVRDNPVLYYNELGEKIKHYLWNWHGFLKVQNPLNANIAKKANFKIFSRTSR